MISQTQKHVFSMAALVTVIVLNRLTNKIWSIVFVSWSMLAFVLWYISNDSNHLYITNLQYA